MITYLLLFILPCILAILYYKNNIITNKFNFFNYLLLFLLTFIIGFRHEVGGDWFIYLPYIEYAKWYSFEETITKSDPAYSLLNWFGGNIFGGIYFVNFVCGLIFSFGLIYYCKSLPRFWLAITVAVPYLITVVSMGYSRQGVAIGVALIAISYLEKQKIFSFVFYITISALFHKSSLILLLISFFLINNKNKIMLTITITLSIVILYYLILAESLDKLITGYIESEYNSSGALIRVLMNALPGGLFLLSKNKLIIEKYKKKIWTIVSYISLIFIPILFLSPSSTAVDRIALYLIPIQLFYWSYFPDLFKNNVNGVYYICILYFFIYIVWLFFSVHSYLWIPYNNILYLY